MKSSLLLICLLAFVRDNLWAQAENEIQVYASPTIQSKWTIIELHSNYTFKGLRSMNNPKEARWVNETLEITTGIAQNMELGFYTFTGINPNGGYEYLGNQIRPRVTVPLEKKWPIGVSLSVEFGFFRPDTNSEFYWQGEIRPIFDKTVKNWYVSINPNVDFILTGPDQQWGIAPQMKVVYTIKQKIGIGMEYYTGLGTFQKVLPFKSQEHLIGPMIDLYTNPKWEVNTGFLFGITPGSNQQIFKLLLGRRFGK